MSEKVARIVAKLLVKIAEDDRLRATLNRRAEEIGASLVRGARKEMKGRFDYLRVPQLETEVET